MRKIYSIFWLLCSVIVASCSTTGTTPKSEYPSPYTQSAAHYIRLADATYSTERQTYQLKAAGRLVQDGMYERAEQLLTNIPSDSLPPTLLNEKYLLMSDIALTKQQAQQALNYLNRIQDPQTLSPYLRLQYHHLRAETYEQKENYVSSARAYFYASQNVTNAAVQQANYDKLTQQLSHLSVTQLNEAINNTPHGEFRGWLELSMIPQQYTDNTLVQALNSWKNRYPNHPGNQQIQQIHPQQHTQQIAVLLPLHGNLSDAGQAVRDGFMAAYYADRNHRTTQIRFYDTSQDSVNALYQKAVHDGASIVVGPLDKTKVDQLNQTTVPTIALNYTSSGQTLPNVYQFGLSPADEVQQVAQRAWKDGKRRAVVITPNDAWGQEIAQKFRQNWQQQGGQVVASLAYHQNQDFDTAIKELLHIDDSEQREKNLQQTLGAQINFQPQRRQDIDMIFLAAFPDDARQIQPLLNYYYAGNIPIYAPSMVYSGATDPLKDRDLAQVKFVDIPWVFNQQHQHNNNTRLYALGMDAYALSQRLNQFNALPNSRYRGKTGNLIVTPEQKIYRELSWGQFKNDGTVRKVG